MAEATHLLGLPSKHKPKDIKPQGVGSGLDADKVDGLHASEVQDHAPKAHDHSGDTLLPENVYAEKVVTTGNYEMSMGPMTGDALPSVAWHRKIGGVDKYFKILPFRNDENKLIIYDSGYPFLWRSLLIVDADTGKVILGGSPPYVALEPEEHDQHAIGSATKRFLEAHIKELKNVVTCNKKTTTKAEITDFAHDKTSHVSPIDAHEIKGKTVDDAAIGDGKVLVYRVTPNKLQYETQAGGGGAAKVTLVIDETEVTVTGTTESLFSALDKTFDFIKDATHLNLASLKVLLQMKVDTGYTGTIKIYVDAEATPRFTFTTTSSTYELKSGSTDISGLSAGLHTFTIKGYTNDAAKKVYLRLYHVLGAE